MAGYDPAGSAFRFEHGKRMGGFLLAQFMGGDKTGETAAYNKGLKGIIHFNIAILKVFYQLPGEGREKAETLDSP
jgi:hypothetical protein